MSLTPQPNRFSLRAGVSLLAAACGLFAPVQAEIVTLEVHPQQTHASINKDPRFHVVMIDPAVAARNKLFLFLPGTAPNPDNTRQITGTAARLGFHAISLRYPAVGKVATLCDDSGDSDCHGRVRREIITGANTSTLIEVSRANSLENRLIQLLKHLATVRPKDRWTQYLGDRDAIRWDRIVVAGISQGGSHAHMIAMGHLVDRCVILANQDWWVQGKRLADWQLLPSATPPERYFGFVHSQDVGFRSGHQQVLWRQLKLTQFGPIVYAEKSSPPYGGTHMLTSAIQPPSGGDGIPNYHGSVAADNSLAFGPDGVTPAFQAVWEYLMITTE